MERTVAPGRLSGEIRIPGSKSHTIRALLIASLASGRSRVAEPLESEDTRACAAACRAMGAVIEEKTGEWLVRGTGGDLRTPSDVVDVRNSGTTLNLCLGAAALGTGWSVFTGDEQIRRRPVGPLLAALTDLGAACFSTRDDGCPPVVVKGPLKGGAARIACPSSQYLSSLLLSCPLAQGDTVIQVTELNERPYVEMTLDWLERQGIELRRRGLEELRIPGEQRYRAFSRRIPGDYSSATFFLCAAAATGSRLRISGLDPEDTQGDRQVLAVLKDMGCGISRHGDILEIQGPEGRKLRGGGLEGREIDLNAMPDALPALAVTGCAARGRTALLNVPQARIKESDRIRVMAEELGKMGAAVEELPDGLIVSGGPLRGAVVDGRGDHRVVMALAVAGLMAAGETRIRGAEAAAVTFPGFFELLEEIRVDE